jgi:sarcosine oxidase subunit beta
MELTVESFRLHKTLESELDCDLERHNAGYLLLIENEQQWALMEERGAALRASGLDVELLSHDEVCRLEPSMDPETLLGALYDPNEGHLNPFALVRAYVRRGTDCGLQVRTQVQATGIDIQGGRVTGVSTHDGAIQAGNVILCTGAWTPGLVKGLALDLPVQWLHGEAIVTEPMPRIANNGMMTASFFETMHGDEEDGASHEQAEPTEKTVGFCLTQRPGGHALIGEASCITDVIGTHSTVGAIPSLAAEAVRRIPCLRHAKVLRTWAGNVLFTGDRRPLLGGVDGIDGLLFATGLKSTIILTPLVGRLAADMVAGRKVDPRLAEFSPMRFL